MVCTTSSRAPFPKKKTQNVWNCGLHPDSEVLHIKFGTIAQRGVATFAPLPRIVQHQIWRMLLSNILYHTKCGITSISKSCPTRSVQDHSGAGDSHSLSVCLQVSTPTTCTHVGVLVPCVFGDGSHNMSFSFSLSSPSSLLTDGGRRQRQT